MFKSAHLQNLPETLRILSPDEQARVLGSNFLSNAGLQEQSEAAGYHPAKNQIYQKIKKFTQQGPETERSWHDYAAMTWPGIIQKFSETLPPCPEKDALVLFDVGSAAPQDVAGVCSPLQSVLTEQIQKAKQDLTQKTRDTGPLRQRITQEVRNTMTQPEGMVDKDYKAMIDKAVANHPDTKAAENELKQARDAVNTMAEAAQAIERLKKTAAGIQQQQDDNKKLYEEALTLARDALGHDNAIVDAVTDVIKNNVTLDASACVQLYQLGALDRVGFVREVLENGDFSAHRPGFAQDSKALFGGHFKDVSKLHDNLIILALMPDDPVEQMTRDEFAEIYKNRADIYKHVDLVEQKIKDNPYIAKIDATTDERLVNELMYATVFQGYQIEMRVGIGGSTVGEPLARLPAYLVPAANIITAVREANQSVGNSDFRTVVPQLSVFSAHRISSQVNGFENDIAERTAMESLAFMKSSVEAIYGPDMLKYISFSALTAEDLEEDKTIDACQDAGAKLADLYFDRADGQEKDGLETTLKSAGILRAEFNKAVNAMGKRAHKHDHEKAPDDVDFDSIEGGRQYQYVRKGIKYAAYHPTYSLFGDTFNKSARPPLRSHKVIKLGGQGEYFFDILQKAITAVAARQNNDIVPCNDPEKSSIFLTGTTGCNPTPYYAGEGDIRLSEVNAPDLDARLAFLQAQNKALSTIGDWLVLQQELIRHHKVAPDAPLKETVRVIGLAAPGKK